MPKSSDVVTNAVVAFNKLLAAKNKRFILFVEDVTDALESMEDIEDEEDIVNESDSAYFISNAVAPNEEVVSYTEERLLIGKSDEDYESVSVYSNHFTGLQMGDLVSTAMGINEKVRSIVEYAQKNYECDRSAGDLITSFLVEEKTKQDSRQLEDDIKDVEDFDS